MVSIVGRKQEQAVAVAAAHDTFKKPQIGVCSCLPILPGYLRSFDRRFADLRYRTAGQFDRRSKLGLL